MVYIGARDTEKRIYQIQQESPSTSREQALKQVQEERKGTPKNFNVGRGSTVQTLRGRGQEVNKVAPGVYETVSQNQRQYLVDQEARREAQVTKTLKKKDEKETEPINPGKIKAELERKVSKAKFPGQQFYATGYGPTIVPKSATYYPAFSGNVAKQRQAQQERNVYTSISVNPTQALTTGTFTKSRGDKPQVQQVSREQYDKLSKYEQQVQAQRRRQENFYNSPFITGGRKIANYVTFGGGKSYEDRSWFGKYSENIVGGVLTAPFSIGGGVAMAGEKAYLTYKGYRLGLGSNIKEEYSRAASSQEIKDTFNPLKPEGAATYTFAILGGYLRGRAVIKQRALSQPKVVYTQGKTLYKSKVSYYAQEQKVNINLPAKNGMFSSSQIDYYRITTPKAAVNVFQRAGLGFKSRGVQILSGKQKGVSYEVAYRKAPGSGYTYKVVSKTVNGVKGGKATTTSQIYNARGKLVGEVKGRTIPEFKFTESKPSLSRKEVINAPGIRFDRVTQSIQQKGVNVVNKNSLNRAVVYTEARSGRMVKMSSPFVDASAEVFYDLGKGGYGYSVKYLNPRLGNFRFVDYPTKPRVSTVDYVASQNSLEISKQPTFVTSQGNYATTQFLGVSDVGPGLVQRSGVSAFNYVKDVPRGVSKLFKSKVGSVSSGKQKGTGLTDVYAPLPSVKGVVPKGMGTVFNRPQYSVSSNSFIVPNTSSFSVKESRTPLFSSYSGSFPKLSADLNINSVSATGFTPASSVSNDTVSLSIPTSDIISSSKTITSSVSKVDTRTKTEAVTKTTGISPSTSTASFSSPKSFSFPVPFASAFPFPLAKKRSVPSLKPSKFSFGTKTSYKPTVFATFTNLKGKSSIAGIKTGLGLRPIPVGKKKKRKKKKR